MREGRSLEVSIIVPVYRNADTLRELLRRLTPVLHGLLVSYEIVFVDDACPDGSSTVLRELAEKDPHVSVLVMGRNVGQQRAVLTGLTYARGERMVVLDADLQDPPEAIPKLLAKLREGFAAVFAGRRGRYEPPFRLLTSRMFKNLLHIVCGVPADAGLFVAMNRQMAERVLAFKVNNPHLVAMIGCAELPTTSIPVARAARSSGVSGYNFWARFRVALLAVALVLSLKLSVAR